jgi:predicted nucleotidyltransferase
MALSALERKGAPWSAFFVRASGVADVLALRLFRYHDADYLWGEPMKPSIALELNRAAVRELAGRFGAANPRIFGSTLRGGDEDGSDLDLLVDALPGVTLFDLGGLHTELEDLLGVRVDLLTPGDLPPKLRERVLSEAQAV